MEKVKVSVPIMSEVFSTGHRPEYLFWVGSAGAFDDRYKKVTREFVKILTHFGISYAVLGTEESDSGDVARRAELDERRGKLMAELVRLENQQRAGTVDTTRYASRRGDLIDQLERVYGELDQHASAPGDGPVA